MAEEPTPSTEGEDYRERYEQLLGELGRLEEHDQELGGLLKLTLSRVLFAVDKAYPGLADAASRIRDKARKQDDHAFEVGRLKTEVEDLARRIREQEAKSQPEDTAAPASHGTHNGSASHVREVLPLLLDRIAFVDSLEGRRARLISAIDDPDDRTLPSILIDRAATLINDMRQAIEKEKSELTRFIEQVTEALADIDQHTQLQSDDLVEQRDARLRLDDTLRQQVDSIDAEVESADDLDGLKLAVRERITRIRQQVQSFQQGEERRQADIEADNKQLRERLAQLEGQTRFLEEQLKQSEAKLFRDNLTGLPNRLAFDHRAHLEIARARRDGGPLTLAIWDLDYFKDINDTLGHQAGDKTLIIVAKTFSKLVRDVDMIARFGGEEFVMLLPGASGEEALKVVDRIRGKLARTKLRSRERELTVTVSCGLTELQIGEEMETAFARADDALYQAKEQGRNRCVLAPTEATAD
ncbi:diguanylate cyclase [Guyparkeria hydrothermalis]|uniref:GGDEF domain-containing protein n=1 Tax=Guyparkeria hydrothermalis TaxID=923 RepID=UPI002021C263|nr:GGDEF domain-containing protein [Guyparkeria hydrothermalis]MCL7745016.1 diguanylate cyclase [Guyparkeria hydrothermalis]